MIGRTRVQKSAARLRTAYRNPGVIGLENTRKDSSGRPLESELSLEEICTIRRENPFIRSREWTPKKARSTRKADDDQKITSETKLKFNHSKI